MANKKKITKKNTKLNNKTIKTENEMVKFISLVVILTVLFLIFYGITIFITREKESETTTPTTNTATFSYDNILLGNLFKQPESSYYVLVEDIEDKNVDAYLTYLSSYKQTEDALRIYYAFLNHPMNQVFVGEETKTNISNIMDLRLKETTLLKIEKGKITKTVVGTDELLAYLEELTK